MKRQALIFTLALSMPLCGMAYDFAVHNQDGIIPSTVTNNSMFASSSKQGQVVDVVAGEYSYSFKEIYQNGTEIYYKIIDGGVEITYRDPDCNCYRGDVIIPATAAFNGTVYPVLGIGEKAFMDSHDLTSVILPNSIKYIGDEAFFDCYSIETLIIPESVTRIGDRAFSGMKNLKRFNGKFATDDHRCLIVNGELKGFAPSGLSTYTLPSTVSVIGKNVFAYSKELKTVIIPTSVTKISEGAFYYSSITSIEIPESVTEIEDNAFGFLFYLTEVYVNNRHPENITLTKGAFYERVRNNATLYVPTGTKAAYEANEVWGAFANIEEMDFPEEDPQESPIAFSVAKSEVMVGTGKQFDLVFNLTNSFQPITFQFWVKAAEGINVLYDAEEEDYAVDFGNRLTDNYSVTTDYKKDDSHDFLVLGMNMTNKCLMPTGEGTFCKIGMVADVEPGEYDIKVDAANFNWLEGGDVVTARPESFTVKLIVRELSEAPGDANGDFVVDATDVAYIVDQMIGMIHDEFYASNADVNNDGKTDATDIAHLIRIMLHMN